MSGEAQILSPVQEAADLQRLLQAVIEGRAVGTPPADWPRTLALAQAHHLDAFLFDAVAARPAELRPEAALMEEWTRRQRSQVVGTYRIRAQRAELLAALKAAGIEAKAAASSVEESPRLIRTGLPVRPISASSRAPDPCLSG